MSKVIINDLTKKIKQKIVLDNVNITFEPGMIYGLYGRNGSGKTMLLRAIAGLIFPSKGKILVNGKTLHKEISFPPQTGIIIENTTLLPQYDAYTNLKLLSKINHTASDQDIRSAIEKVGLDSKSKQKVKSFSLGMKQRLSIAQAIFEDPKLLLLDEPTNSLDEESIKILHQILLEYKQRGCTILVASHNKEDLDVLADKMITVTEGRVAF